MSNIVGNYEDLAEAIRKHWSVETNNHVRDVSLQEDKMRSKKEATANNGRLEDNYHDNFTKNKVSE